jgi:hypothetical protein
MMSVSLCIHLNDFWMPEPIFMKFGMHIMAPELHLKCVINKYLPSVCVYPIVARHRIGKNVTVAKNTQETTEKLLDGSFSIRSV